MLGNHLCYECRTIIDPIIHVVIIVVVVVIVAFVVDVVIAFVVDVAVIVVVVIVKNQLSIKVRQRLLPRVKAPQPGSVSLMIHGHLCWLAENLFR